MTALDVNAPTTSRPMLWTGWVLSGLLIAFMALDTVIKLLDLPQVVATMTEMGIPPSLDRLIGAVELVSLLLYIFPRTAILGAILLTGVLAGRWQATFACSIPCSATPCSASISGCWPGAACGFAAPSCASCCPSVPDRAQYARRLQCAT